MNATTALFLILATLGMASPPPRPADAAAAEPAGLIRLGQSLTKRGDYSTAEIAFWQVLNRSDSPPTEKKDALLGLAALHRREGSLTKASAIYEKYVKEYPDDERVPDALLDLGRTLRAMGAYRMAISRFYSVINSTLKFSAQGFDHYKLLAKTAQFEIAQTYFDAGQYAEAAKYFSRVRLLELAPEDRARAHFMAAFSEERSGQREAAVATLRAFLEQWPDDRNVPEARYLLATTLRLLNRPQEALAVTFDLLRTEHARVATDPQRWSYWQRKTGNQIANEFFLGGDAFDALAIYQGLRGLSEDASWRLPLTYQIALCYERLRQVDQARAAYQWILAAVKPDAPGTDSRGEIPELARMARWRLAQLDWDDQAERRISEFFPVSEHPSPPTKAPAPHS